MINKISSYEKGCIAMQKKHTGIIIAIAAVVVLVVGIISSYNGLVSTKGQVDEYTSNIDAQLQRRADLIPNLVNTVKGYTNHEEEVFTSLAEARQNLMSAKTPSEKADADQQLSTALANVVAIAEAYPELKSNELYVSMMDELEGCENRISYARTEYNSVAKEYNIKIQKFPTVIMANMFGFKAVDYFEASQGAQQVPQVNF